MAAFLFTMKIYCGKMCITLTLNPQNTSVMLDKRTLKLLDIINNECVGGGYKVFDLNDLVLSMPEHFSIDCDGVRECLSALREREYISVKYQDEREICLSPLSKGRFVFENRLDDEIEKQTAAKKYFLYSALGACVGGGTITLIAIILFLLLGAGYA